MSQLPFPIVRHHTEDFVQPPELLLAEYRRIEAVPEGHASVDVVPVAANLRDHVLDRMLTELVFELDRSQQIDLFRRLDEVVQHQIVGNLIVLRRMVALVAAPDDEVGVKHRFKGAAERQSRHEPRLRLDLSRGLLLPVKGDLVGEVVVLRASEFCHPYEFNPPDRPFALDSHQLPQEQPDE